MFKLSKKTRHYLIIAVLVMVVRYIVKYIFTTPIREGVVFTPYDNRKLFTKPWDKFCISPPSSCDQNLVQRNPAIGVSPIGCNCKGVGDAGDLDPKCDGTNHLYFYK